MGAPHKVFYGWWIVAASFLIGLYVGGSTLYGFTTIFEPIASEFGWGYTQISLAASLRGLEVGLFAPLVGILVDRWGPRKLIFSGAIIISLGLILLSRITSVAMLYGAFVLVGIGVSACTSIVLMTAVANWFEEKVGIAGAIVVSGFGCAGFLVPVIVKLIDIYEWRMTIVILSFGMLGLVLPLSFLFRHKPEQYGYLPDGRVKGAVIAHKNWRLLEATEVKIKVKQIIKSNTFWHIALAFMYHMLVLSAIITHIMPYLSSIGVARSKSSLIAGILPMISVGGRLSLGWLADRFNRKWLVAGVFAMIGLGLLCFGYASTASIWPLVSFLFLFGLGFGGIIALRPALVREYFGRINFGTVFGFVVGIGMLGTIIGPTLAGYVFDNWGSYQGIWFVFAGLAAAALIVIVTTPPFSTTKGNVQ